jgi:response regulator RpfG family c-di-GMP phosphodiesterase
MTDTILFVDDEPAVLDGIRRLIRKDYTCVFATSGQQALALLDGNPSIAVVCSDMRMPGMDGATLLAEVQKRHSDVVRLMLTGNFDQGTAVEAINRGHIFSFLNKPVHHERLMATLNQALKLRRAMRAEKDLLKRTLGGAVRTLVEVLSHGFPRIFNRSLELRDLARKFGPAMGGGGWKLDMAAMLGQIGWTTVPLELFERGISGAALSDAERNLVRQVPLIGARLIGHIPRLEGVADVIRNLQRGYDGSGYPEDGPAGDMLPVEARILRLLTDAIFVSGGQPLSLSTVAKLRKRMGVYDPKMLDALARTCVPGVAAGPAPLPVSELSDPALLSDGDRLVADIRFADGETVLAAGTLVTPLLVEKLTNLRLLRPFALPIRVARATSAVEAAA